MDLSVILFGLKALLPGLGQVIYQIPWVRRYTRWVVQAFGTVHSYLILLGMPPAEPVVDPTVPTEPTMALTAAGVMVAGISWSMLWTNPVSQVVISLGWGWVDGKVSQYRHRAIKYRKIVKG